MERDYQALRAADLLKLTAAVQKAENDWPEKKADLESKLVAVTTLPAQAERQWQASSELRRKVAANDLAGSGLRRAHRCPRTRCTRRALALPQKTAGAGGIRAASFTMRGTRSWSIWTSRAAAISGYYKEKIRTVRTHFTDVAAKKSETSHGRALGGSVASPVSGGGT